MQQKPPPAASKAPGRVSLPPIVAPPNGSPFAGISNTHAPARNTSIPNLTQHVAIAKARVQALKDAGLTSEAKREAATQAEQIIAQHNPPAKRAAFLPPAKKPPAPTLPASLAAKPPAVQRIPPVMLPKPAAATAAKNAPSRTLASSPATPRRGATPSFDQLVAYANAHPEAATSGHPSIPIPSIVKDAAGAAKSNFFSGLRDPVSMLLPFGVGQALRAEGINVTDEAAKQGAKAATKIRSAGENTGSINVSLLSPAQAAQFPGEKTVTEQQIKDLEAQKGGLGGLPQAARDTLINGAVQNGWPRWMAVKSVDSDLIHLYANKPAAAPIQFAKNLGAWAATQAGAPAGVVAIGDAAIQAAKGNPKPLEKQAQQFVEGSMVGLPVVGPHPFLQSAYWQPGETIQNLSLVAGLADRAAGAATHFAPGVERTVTPEGFTAPVSRGELSTRPLNRAIQVTRDAYVRSDNPILNAKVKDQPVLGPLSPTARRTALARDAYQATRDRSVAPTMQQSAQLRANVMRTANSVGKERAVALNAYLRGSDPVERAAFYDQVSKELGPVKGRAAAAQAKLSAKHPITEATLTPKDAAYVDAVRQAAEFSTQTRAAAGQLSADLAGRYRAYHEPIVIAAKSGDALAQRAQALHNEWTHALAKKLTPEELKPLADSFSKTLDEFTQQHAERGGTTPVFVPEVVPQTVKNMFKREASITATPKVAKLKATQDKLVSSGEYRSLPQDVSLEVHRAAVVRARIDHFKAVNDEYATKAENGAPAQPGVTYVKAENLRSPVKLEHTVGEHNLTDEQVHSTIEQMRLALEGGKIDVPPGGYIPAHGDIRAIPTTIYNDLHASTLLPRGAPIGHIYDTANRAYQRFMLSKPSTGVANIVGNPILAGIGGASPLDIAKGYGLVKNAPETIPPNLLMGQGLAGKAGTKIARTPIGKFINFSLSHQRASEDAARAALYHHLVGPYVRSQVKELGVTADQVLKDMAAGRDPQGAVFAKKVEDFLGTMRDSRKMSPGTEQFLSRSILFHRWLGHVLTLSLYTLPIKYPGRSVLLQRISEIGDDYRKHHGVYPSWYLSMVPLMQHIMTTAGVPGQYTRVFPTGSFWPTANLPMPLADSQGANPYSAIIGSTQPVVRSALEAPTGLDWESLTPYKDAQGNAISPLSSQTIPLLLGQEYRNLPYASVVTPFAGMGDTARPGAWTQRVHKNKYGKPLPDGFGTSAIPYGGNTPAFTPEYALGAISRLFGGGSGLQDLPAQTRGTNYSRTAQLVKARAAHNKLVRERARARAKKG